MRILKVEPGKAPYETQIGDDLQSMQALVGGYIQAVYPFEQPVALVCCESGKLDGLPLSRALRDSDGDIYDIVAGNFFIVGLGESDFTDLPHTLKKRRPGPLAHYAALAGLPHSWTPVRSFRESYYVNCFNPYPVWISDSLFVRQTMDGPRPSRISAAERIAPTHYRLRTTAGDAGIDRVDIYLVDTVCRMAVFAFSNDRKTERFQSLYVPFETGLEMDMIDFHSLELPDESEVEWDETDFEALISGAVPLRETDPKTDKTNNE